MSTSCQKPPPSRRSRSAWIASADSYRWCDVSPEDQGQASGQAVVTRSPPSRRQEMPGPRTPENVSMHLRDLRGKPHAEVVIIKRDTDGPGAVGICYNTLSLPGPVSDEQFRALDPEALKAEFGGD